MKIFISDVPIDKARNFGPFLFFYNRTCKSTWSEYTKIYTSCNLTDKVYQTEW